LARDLQKDHKIARQLAPTGHLLTHEIGARVALTAVDGQGKTVR